MKKKSEWLKIEKAREIRQWIGLGGKLVIGVMVGKVYLDNNPDVKRKWDCFGYELKKKVCKIFHKEN